MTAGRAISNCSIKLNAIGTLTNVLTASSASTPSAAIGGALLNVTLTDGNGNNQIKRLYENPEISIASGDTLDIDLYDFAGMNVGAGDGKDALGQAMDMEEVVFFFIQNTKAITDDAAGQLEINPTNPSNPWLPMPSLNVATNYNALRQQGFLIMGQPHHQGFDVIDGASHKIRLKANGGPVTVKLEVWGRSSDTYS